MMTTFSKNLKRFRVAKNMTQEQAADYLGVSAQTISRWECNTTLPDVTILPEIARLYCVSIDDLYKESSVAYENYAARLLSTYESTHKPEDFLRADMEYQKLLHSGEASMNDLRLYGILNQYMMKACLDKAQYLFEQILQRDPAEDPKAYQQTQRQYIFLQCQVGKSEEVISKQREKLQENSQDVNNWINLIAAYQFSGQFQEACVWVEKALSRFPENAMVHVYAGDIYRSLHQYEKAFAHWDQALQLDSTYLDAQYSKGFCYMEMGDYRKAYEIWCQLTQTLTLQGFDLTSAYPKQLAEDCLSLSCQ